MRSTRLLAVAFCALATAPSLVAQSTLVMPLAPPAAAVGNIGNAFPWRRLNGAMHYMQIYAASNFKGITTPIFIKRIRFRAFDLRNVTYTTTGGTYSNVRIRMSTAAVAHTAASVTFASNHGTDVAQVYPKVGGTNLGPVTVKATRGTGSTVPGIWYIDITLAQQFAFDPTKGKDLCVEIQHDGTYAGTGLPAYTAAYSGTAASPQGGVIEADDGDLILLVNRQMQQIGHVHLQYYMIAQWPLRIQCNF